MKLLVDIGHPAHVHYFKNTINNLKQKGHQVLITTRDKEITLTLLNHYNFPYVCTGKNLKGKFKKLFSLLRNDWVILQEARRFKPDIFLSFFTPFAAHVGRWMKKPVIGLMDSEFDKMRIKLTKPYTDYIFTPQCYKEDYGKNHFRFNGFMETFYLHPNQFTPDPAVLQKLSVEPGEFFSIVRFVAFNAGHDRGQSGMDAVSKRKIIAHLLTKGKVFISSEKSLPDDLKRYQFHIAPADFHSALYYAGLYVGEGITIASECAHLGTPAVLINSIRAGYIEELERKDMVYHFTNPAEALSCIIRLTDDAQLKQKFQKKTSKMISELLDCTDFLTHMLENFPASLSHLQPGKTINMNQQTLAYSNN